MAEVDIAPEFKPTIGDRFFMWLQGRVVRASVSEMATNNDFTSSFGLLERIGEQDVDETEAETAGRFPRLKKLRKMYKGEAEKGNEVVGAVTEFHAALQFGQGIVTKDLKSDDPENPSDEFVAWNEFLDLNHYSEERLLRLGASGELDGQILLRLAPDETTDPPTVRAWTVPLLLTKYRVEFANPWEATKAVLFEKDAQHETEELKPEEFVFVRFRGVEDGTYGIPRAMRVIERCEALSDAISDWRKINRVYSSPTPVFSGKDVQSLTRIKAQVKGMNWKIGKAFIKLVDDEFELVSLEGSEHQSIKDEVVMNAQIVSGATNVPVHYLGFPELMSNRSVADSDMEPALKATESAHVQYVGFFEELIEKVFSYLNVLHGRSPSNFYDPKAIGVVFPSVRKGDVGEALKAWLPARVAKEVSQETFHEKIGVDPLEERKRLEKEGDEVDEDGSEEDDEIERLLDQAEEDELAARRSA